MARALEAAAALLLREPDARLRAMVAHWAGEAPPLSAMRQDFFDVMCVAQSRRYVPAYAHVLRRARWEDGSWALPPARHDGGRVVEGYYARLGFDRRRLVTAPVFAAPHLPGDHLGFMLAFLAFGQGLGEDLEDGQRRFVERQLGAFTRRHLDGWTETYAELVEARGGPYLAAVAAAVREAVALARDLWTLRAAAPPAPAARSPAPIRAG